MLNIVVTLLHNECIIESMETYRYNYDGDLTAREVSRLETAVNTAMDTLEFVDLHEVRNKYEEEVNSDEMGDPDDVLSTFATEFLEEYTTIENDGSHLWNEMHHEFVFEVLKPKLKNELGV